MDVSKAFDTVSHENFPANGNYGFRGPIYDLFQNYWSNRQQIVEIDEHRSCRETVMYGVQGGAVLRPLLILVYIKSLVKV